MRRDHVMTGGKWPPHMGFSSRMGSKLDRNSSELVDFANGGTWAPTSPICIGGKGLAVNSSSIINGGVTTKPGYGGKKPQIELEDMWPTFSAPRSRVTTIPWARGETSWGLPTMVTRDGSVTGWFYVLYVAPSMVLADHHLHDGATLTKLTATYRLTGSKPTALPPSVDTMTVTRWTRATDIAAAGLHTAGTVGGVVYSGDTATRVIATVDDYFNGGNVISLAYTPDRNNVIDKATYYYHVAMSVYGEVDMHSLQLEYTVPNMKWE